MGEVREQCIEKDRHVNTLGANSKRVGTCMTRYMKVYKELGSDGQQKNIACLILHDLCMEDADTLTFWSTRQKDCLKCENTCGKSVDDDDDDDDLDREEKCKK